MKKKKNRIEGLTNTRLPPEIFDVSQDVRETFELKCNMFKSSKNYNKGNNDKWC